MRILFPIFRQSSQSFQSFVTGAIVPHSAQKVSMRVEQVMQTDIQQELTTSLKTLYGFKEVVWLGRLGGLSSLNYEIRGDGNLFVLKKYRSKIEEEVERIENISQFLESHNLPAIPPFISSRQKRHFFENGKIFALYPKTQGTILHEPTFTPHALQMAAQLLAKFHQLKPPANLRLEKLYTNKINNFKLKFRSDSEQIISLISQRSLDRRVDDLTKDLILAKTDFLNQFPFEDLFSPYLDANQLVHGDFHNENLLFDESHQKIVRLLDFEETHLGHRVEDVMHFILLACCNSGYEKSNLEKAKTFLQSYSEAFPLSRPEILFGLHFELFKEFSSFFLERCLFETRDYFLVQFIERDLKKARYFTNNLNSFLQDIIS